jgi:hypothetical protein
MKAINYKTIAILSLLVFVFLLGFSFSVQAYRISQQELNSPVSRYLRENYGVNSIEEYRAKLEQEIWLNYSRQMEALASEYPELNFSEWRNPAGVYRQYGTSTYQPPKIISQQPFYVAVFSEPVTALQVFSLSGLGLIGLAAVPPVRKNKRLKQALVLGVVILCVFSIGYFVGLTAAQTGTITIEPNSFQTEASYIIFTDGTKVYARNGKTGAIDYSGTDATTVIQSAINALSSGVVFIKDGLYIITASIIPKSHVYLVGESWNTILKLKDNATEDATHSNVIYSNDEVEDIVIRNLQIDGNKANQTFTTSAHTWNGIYFRNQARHVYIDHCYVHDCRICGIMIRATTGKESYDNWVMNSRVMNNAWNDVNFYAYGTGAKHYGGGIVNNFLGGDTGDMAISLYNAGSGVADVVYDILIQGNIIYPLTGSQGSAQNPQAHFGIQLEVGSTRCKVYDNIILGAAIGIITHGSGTGKHEICGNTIYVKDLVLGTGSGFPIGINLLDPGNVIRGNKIYIPATVTQNAQGIRTDINGGYNVIEYNYVYDLGSSGTTTGLRNYQGNYNVWRYNVVKGCDTPANLAGATGTIIEGNIFNDKPCEASGSATISSGTSVVVTHGLAGTPTVVTVTPRSTGYGTFAVTARNSTTFTITVTTSGTYTFDWYAEYKP